MHSSHLHIRKQVSAPLILPGHPRLLAAPEGLAKLEEELSDANVTIVLASIDEKLNEKSYIVPGLGDAGDRLYGIAG